MRFVLEVCNLELKLKCTVLKMYVERSATFTGSQSASQSVGSSNSFSCRYLKEKKVGLTHPFLVALAVAPSALDVAVSTTDALSAPIATVALHHTPCESCIANLHKRLKQVNVQARGRP